MGKSQKGPSYLGRTKKSDDQHNIGYYTWNINLAERTPFTSPPLPTPVANYLKKNQYQLGPGPDKPDITRLVINTKCIPTITRVQNIRTNMSTLSYQKDVGHLLRYI